MALKGLTKVEKMPDPEVVEYACPCNRSPGFLARINGKWWMFLATQSKEGHLASSGTTVDRCRGCFRKLTDSAGNTIVETAPYEWGKDEQLDTALRTAARKMLDKKLSAKPQMEAVEVTKE